MSQELDVGIPDVFLLFLMLQCAKASDLIETLNKKFTFH